MPGGTVELAALLAAQGREVGGTVEILVADAEQARRRPTALWVYAPLPSVWSLPLRSTMGSPGPPRRFGDHAYS